MSHIHDESRIPIAMLEGIKRYVQHGIEPGSCLLAILENDLKEAFKRADDGTAMAMPAILSYLYNKTPMGCSGSPERVRTWMQRHELARAWYACTVATLIMREHLMVAQVKREPTPEAITFVPVEPSMIPALDLIHNSNFKVRLDAGPIRLEAPTFYLTPEAIERLAEERERFVMTVDDLKLPNEE